MHALEKNFDRELGLAELLGRANLARIRTALAALLGDDFSLVSCTGEALIGAGCALEAKIPLKMELEPLGFLLAADGVKARSAAALLELLLKSGARYQMASDLHLEAVHADYEALQEKHAALQQSEARYRQLAAELEIRVAEQVKTIEIAQRQLYQAEKLASVGQLAAGVAHEINNPLGFIRSNLSSAKSYILTLKKLSAPFKAHDMDAVAALWRQLDIDFILEDFPNLIEESVSGADRVARIVSDLKGFSRVDHAEREVVNLNDNLHSVCNVISAQISGRIELQLQLGELPLLSCQSGHMNQAFLSLLLNAVQSIADKGIIRVQSDTVNDEIRVRVSDSGCGMSPEILQKIFDPFFTTRKVGAGTGLGLSVARDVVMAHGGRIEAQSTEGVGTTMSVFLPSERTKND